MSPSPSAATLPAASQLPSSDLLARWSRPGPRYTSYPTFPVWTDADDADVLGEALRGLEAPLHLYVHVPFCEQRCDYCGCQVTVARQQRAGDRYLDALARQMDGLDLPAGRWPVERLHLGGGTPTWLSPHQLWRLFALIDRRFRRVPGMSRSVELDPHVTTEAHLAVLAEAGVTRVSLGVQSFASRVLEAAGRTQAEEDVVDTILAARRLGVESFNIDLMYGLPQQTPDDVEQAIRIAHALGVTRLALFGYAHVPWVRPHQRVLEDRGLPHASARRDQLLRGHAIARELGWIPVGFDHFARPGDPLAVAASTGGLHRDFMGFTARRPGPMLGLGPSAISAFDDRFVQQETKLGPWLAAARRGEVPVARSHRLSDDDRLRRDAILDLTCRHLLDFDVLSARHGVDARVALADSLEALAPLADDGLVTLGDHGVVVTEKGRLLVRHVARAFDAHAPRRTDRFSAAV